MSDQFNGVSQEDLEKAATVRLFEKAADASGIDLNELSNDQLNELFGQFERDVLPRLVAEKQASAELEAKLASLTEEQIYDLFEKQAATEPALVAAGGLEALTDEQLAMGFSHFVEHVLPIMAEQDFAPVTPQQAAKMAAAEDAQVKLAEAEMLGRHMARGFFAESDKIAAEKEEAEKKKKDKDDGENKEAMTVGSSSVKSVLGGLKTDAKDAARGIAGRLKGMSPGAKAGVAGAAGAAGGAAAGAGAMKLHQEKKGSVTLSPEDVAKLAEFASAGDLAAFQKAADAIQKAAELPPQFRKSGDEDKKDGDKDKKEEKDGEEKKASALDLLVEARATELHNAWLAANGRS